jgi:hypothetical protein
MLLSFFYFSLITMKVDVVHEYTYEGMNNKVGVNITTRHPCIHIFIFIIDFQRKIHLKR